MLQEHHHRIFLCRWKEASYDPLAIGGTLDLTPYALRMSTEVVKRMVSSRLSVAGVSIAHLNLKVRCGLLSWLLLTSFVSDTVSSFW